MPVLGRDEQFAQLEREIARRVTADGTLRSLGGAGGGSQVHISVMGPQLGGVTCFLQEAAERLEKRPGVRPFFKELQAPEEIESAFRSLLATIAQAAEMEVPPEDDLDALFSACARYHQRHGRVPVIILDVARAIRRLNVVAEDAPDARMSPLLQRLRVLGTYMEDREPTLIVVVGWNSDFPADAATPRLAASDVCQRYAPTIPLWPDFERDDAWPVYADILAQHGLKVGKSFPGFCRGTDKQTPVGVLIQKAHEQQRHVVDGQFLFDLLRDRVQPDPDLDGLDRDTLIRLCLEDGSLDPSQSSFPRRYLEPSGEGGLVASSALYGKLSLRPPTARLAFERRVRNRFESADTSLNAEILKAALRLVDADVTVSADGAYACTTNDVQMTVPDEPVHVAVLCSVTREVSPALQQALIKKLKEADEGKRRGNSYVLLLMHGGNEETARGIAKRLRTPDESGLEVRQVKSTAQGGGLRPAALAVVDIDVNLIVDALASGEESELPGRLSTSLRERVKAMQKAYPLLQSADFMCSTLHAAIENAYRPTALREQDHAAAAKQLEKVGVVTIQAQPTAVVWQPEKDKVLGALVGQTFSPPEAALDRLSESLTIRPADRSELLNALLTAYAKFLRRLEQPPRVSADTVETFCAQRTASLKDELSTVAAAVRPIDPGMAAEIEGEQFAKADELAQAITKAEERRAELTAAFDERRAAAEKLLETIRTHGPQTDAALAAEVEGTAAQLDRAGKETMARLEEALQRATAVLKKLEDAQHQRVVAEGKRQRLRDELKALRAQKFAPLLTELGARSDVRELEEKFDELEKTLADGPAGERASPQAIQQAESALPELKLRVEVLAERAKRAAAKPRVAPSAPPTAGAPVVTSTPATTTTPAATTAPVTASAPATANAPVSITRKFRSDQLEELAEWLVTSPTLLSVEVKQ
jgi:hypothetical protein